MGMYLDANEVPRVYRVVIKDDDHEDDTYTITIFDREVETARQAIIDGYQQSYGSTVTVDIYPA